MSNEFIIRTEPDRNYYYIYRLDVVNPNSGKYFYYMDVPSRDIAERVCKALNKDSKIELPKYAYNPIENGKFAINYLSTNNGYMLLGIANDASSAHQLTNELNMLWIRN